MSASTTASFADFHPDDLLDSEQAAALLHTSVVALRQLRFRGVGPAYVQRVRKGRVLYRVRDLRTYAEGNVRQPGARSDTDWITSTEAADLARTSTTEIRLWAQDGRIRARGTGRGRRYAEADVIAVAQAAVKASA
ncbi:helix-turn-helix domain-containing protein [Tsukamurella ocularis]